MAKAISTDKKDKNLKILNIDPLKTHGKSLTKKTSGKNKPATSLKNIQSQLNELIIQREAELKLIADLKQQLQATDKQVNSGTAQLSKFAELKDLKKLKNKLKETNTECHRNTQTLSQEILIFKSLIQRIKSKIKLLEQDITEKQLTPYAENKTELLQKINQFELQLKQFDKQESHSSQDLFEKIIVQTERNLKSSLAEQSTKIQSEADIKFEKINKDLNENLQQLLDEKFSILDISQQKNLTPVIEKQQQYDTKLSTALSQLEDLNSSHEKLSEHNTLLSDNLFALTQEIKQKQDSQVIELNSFDDTKNSLQQNIENHQLDIKNLELQLESQQQDFESHQHELKNVHQSLENQQHDSAAYQQDFKNHQHELKNLEQKLESQQQNFESQQHDLKNLQQSLENQQHDSTAYQQDFKNHQLDIDSLQHDTKNLQLNITNRQNDIESYQRDMETHQNELEGKQHELEVHQAAGINQLKNTLTTRSQLFLVALLTLCILSVFIIIKSNSNYHTEQTSLIAQLKKELKQDTQSQISGISQKNTRVLSQQLKQLEDSIQKIKYETKRDTLTTQSQQEISQKTVAELSSKLDSLSAAVASSEKQSNLAQESIKNKPVAVTTQAVNNKVIVSAPPLNTLQAPYYSIQLLGARKQKTIENFIKKHQFSEAVKIHQRTLDDKPWFILTYGQYSRAKEAFKVLKQLPATLQSNKPWVKKFP